MTVLLVLLIFAVFLLIDHFFHKPAPRAAQEPRALPAGLQALVRGFRLPERLSYHPGHTWALGESPTLVRVGMDEFASKLLGPAESLALPARGTWVRQGQRFASVTRGGRTVGLVSPVEGVVEDVNTGALGRDPYGDGWLMVVSAPDKATSLRNLLRGAVARLWAEEAVQRLSPALAQDGGEAVADFAVASGRDWEGTAREFLLG